MDPVLVRFWIVFAISIDSYAWSSYLFFFQKRYLDGAQLFLLSTVFQKVCS